jgi:hypothetical protein
MTVVPRFSAAALGAVLTITVACAGPEGEAARPTEPRVPAPGAPAPPETERVRLERLAAGASREALRDGCFAAVAWGMSDQADAGALLDRLVSSYAASPKLSSRDAVACYPAALHARLIRAWRLGTFDGAVELRSPDAKVRAATLAFLAHARAGAAESRAALDDPSREVRLAAYQAIEDLGDQTAVPQLDAVVVRIPPELPAEKGKPTAPERMEALVDRRWACAVLEKLGASGRCPDQAHEGGGIGGIVGGSSGTQDPCTTTRADLASDDPVRMRKALQTLAIWRFSDLTRPLDPLMHDRPARETCPLERPALDPLLANEDVSIRASAAILVLAMTHAPLPDRADALRRPR